MAENPLAVFEKLDPKLLANVRATEEFAMADGVLPRKIKLLIAMALDAAHGAINGVNSLAHQARAAGATSEEIAETIRVVGYVNGVGSVYTAAAGLRDQV